jgi:hypothetical protein
MIIQLPPLSRGMQGGRPYKLNLFYFSNNNLAIRRECADSLGGYAPEVEKSEDLDLCFRAICSDDWILVRDPQMKIDHKPRTSVIGMLRQMWGWGFYQALAYKRTGFRGCFLYWVDGRSHTISRGYEKENKGPLIACFFTDFHLVHLLAASALLCCGSGFGLLFSLLSVAIALRLFVPIFRGANSLLEGLKLACLFYLSNWVFLIATLIGGLRRGVFLLPCSMLMCSESEPKA